WQEVRWSETAVENPLQCLCSPRLPMDEENDSCDDGTSCTVGINKFVRSGQEILELPVSSPVPIQFSCAEEVGGKSDLFILWSSYDRFKELERIKWNKSME
ncbi:unnamed protein product, partial [Heterotrigona itama]